MRNEKRDNGFATSDINIAAVLLCQEGATYDGLEEYDRIDKGDEKMSQYLFIVKGDPVKLEEIKTSWFQGRSSVVGDIKEFTKKRKFLLNSLPRNTK